MFVHIRAAPILDAHIVLLIDDRTQARRVEEVRQDFVVNVSHELKTPVGGLSLLAEALLDAQGDPEATERFAHRMQLESARLSQLIKEIVDLSQLQSQDILAGAKPVRLADVVKEAIEVSQIEAAAKNIAVSERCDPDVHVRGDFGLLVTAVRNLVGNAIAYSPEGTDVGVGVRAVDGLATITVTDRGRGIPAAEQERIFERFYRGDAARSRSTGAPGSGWPSSSTSAPTTAARSQCGAKRGRARRSRSACRCSPTLRPPSHTAPPTRKEPQHECPAHSPR